MGCGIFAAVSAARIEDLTALNALYRRGRSGGMIDDFINRKHGKTKLRSSSATQDIYRKRTV